ncbi:MAG TPA: glycosyltransferase family 2 protein [Thermoanaerobaculia bacterium]|nr:glycosyltransferase family 2 protein [Thermoanaerobaculia bacterium]
MIVPEPAPPRVALRPVPQPVDLSILIVTWNSERWIERCLRSIDAACNGIAYEVVVYDNASTDATLVHIADDVHVIRANANDGFAAGTNRALAQSHGRYVFFLNPDCELAPNALTLLINFLDQNPHVAAATPLLQDESGDSQREFQLRRLPTLGSLAAEILLADKLFPHNRTTARYRYRDADLTHPIRVEQPAAAAFLIRREVFDEIGPLDERFEPAWFEDVDFCRRLAAAGKEIFAVPAARARHFGGASLEHVGLQRFTDVWYRNMWRYAQKWFTPGEREALRWMIIAGMLLRCAASVAGFANGNGRWPSVRAYANVAKKAFRRWDDSLPSSS